MKAIVNKIIPFSAVDGPGNRTTVYLQGCNLNCSYCHSPQMMHACINCGKCVESCKVGALIWKSGKIIYNHEKCIQCDTCIHICPNKSSPKTREMTSDEIHEEILKNIPFIRGLTVAGGECTLHSVFLKELLPKVKQSGLSILLNSNGTYDFEQDKEILEMVDGVMLDIKAFDKKEHERVTGHDNKMIIKNLKYLAEQGKLFEVRTAIIPEFFDYKKTVEDVARILQPFNQKKTIRYKLVTYWSMEALEENKKFRSPNNEEMDYLKSCLESYGFTDIIII